jgi:hypothetical protein
MIRVQYAGAEDVYDTYHVIAGHAFILLILCRLHYYILFIGYSCGSREMGSVI